MAAAPAVRAGAMRGTAGLLTAFPVGLRTAFAVFFTRF
jgi:hypothetical protein